jgi:hypothetical protein
LIRKCWGDVPRFDGPGEVIHLRQDDSSADERGILLTCVFMTRESNDGNACKPTLMVIRFSGVVFWEADHYAEAHGIRLAEILSAPPTGFLSVDVLDRYYIVCRKIAVLSCAHEPFPSSEDDAAAESKAVSQAFIDLASYMEIANFDDPDEAQGVREVVSRCLSEANPEERAILCQAALERIRKLREKGVSEGTIEFYETFVHRCQQSGK